MNEMHFPWLEISILIPAVGAAVVGRLPSPELARKWSVALSGASLLFAAGAWLDFEFLHSLKSEETLSLAARWLGRDIFVIDSLSAPLLPLVALLYFLTNLATLRTKVRRFSFAWTLFSEALLLATFSCQEPWGIVALLTVGTLPPYFELRARGKSARVYVLYMALFIVLLVIGESFVEREGREPTVHSGWAIVPLLGAVLVRCGIAPFHVWMTDLFEKATFGTALLFVTPIVGAYAAVRLVLPVAPDWVLGGMGAISLFTAVYAAGMSLIQRDARRFFCYMFLSHSALVLVGLEAVTPIALTGALCVWLSASLSLAGFGLTLRALESRCGRLSLADFQGHYRQTPKLAMCFGLTGLASVGFPGTLGYVGAELLVDGAVEAYPYIGVAVVAAAALNGIAVVQAYFRLFTGTEYESSVSLKIRTRERFALLALAALILIGGLAPQSNVASRHRAAKEIIFEHRLKTGESPTSGSHSSEDEHSSE